MAAPLFTFGTISGNPMESNPGIAPEITMLQGQTSVHALAGDQTSTEVNAASIIQQEPGMSSQVHPQYLPWGYGVPWSYDRRLEMVIHRKECMICMQYHSHMSAADLEQSQSYLDALEVRKKHFQDQFTSKDSKSEDVSTLQKRVDRRDERIIELKNELTDADAHIKDLSDDIQHYKQELARLEDFLSSYEDNGHERKRARKLPAAQSNQSARIDEDVEMAAPSTYAGALAKPVTAVKPTKASVAYIHFPDKESVERNAALDLPKPLGIPQTITYKWVKGLFAEANEPNNEDALVMAKTLVAWCQDTKTEKRTEEMKFAAMTWRLPDWAKKLSKREAKKVKSSQPEAASSSKKVKLSGTPAPTRDGTADDWMKWFAANPHAPFRGLESGSLAIADFRAIETMKRLGPSKSEKGKEPAGLRAGWTRNFISLVAIPNYYRDLCAAYQWNISTERTFNRYTGSIANLSQTEVAQHLTKNGITLADVQSYQPFARRWLKQCSEEGELGEAHDTIGRTWLICNNMGVMFPIEADTGVIPSGESQTSETQPQTESPHTRLLDNLVSATSNLEVDASSQSLDDSGLNRTEESNILEPVVQLDRSTAVSDNDVTMES
jgi:hypothetical protein